MILDTNALSAFLLADHALLKAFPAHTVLCLPVIRYLALLSVRGSRLLNLGRCLADSISGSRRALPIAALNNWATIRAILLRLRASSVRRSWLSRKDG